MRLSQCYHWTTCLATILLVSVCHVEADEEYTGGTHRSVSRVRRQNAFVTANERGSMFNRSLRIVTIHQEPYTIVTPVAGSADKFEYTGFIPDLIEALARELYFKYEFYNVTYFGRLDNTTNQWNGMIGEVILNDQTGGTRGADIAAATLRMTSGRERVVNFLTPFLHFGVTAVVRRPETTDEQTLKFSIFQPLTPALWALILLSTLIVALFLWAMNVYNPYEWAGRQRLGRADVHQAELFSLPGAVWFTFTSLGWQGFERAPRSVASKFLVCIWFAFVAVVLTTYTAGIVNTLYWSSMMHRSVSVKHRYIDLAHAISSGDFVFGTIKNGQTYRYIMEMAPGEEFEIIRQSWRSPEGQFLMVANVNEGIERVRDPNSNYVFLMENLPAKYHTNRRPCDLTTVGEPFGSRSFGFAVPTGMPFSWSDELHRAILELMEEGDIEALEHQWFAKSDECWNVTMKDRAASDISAAEFNVDGPRSVDIATFTGPLVMILVGLMTSVGIAIAEIIYYRKLGQYRPENQPQEPHLSINPDDRNM